MHAGDLTTQGTYSELKKTITWLREADFKVKIIVCGNHDITCDIPFYQQYGAYYHNKKLEDPSSCIALFQSDPSIILLNHESRQVRITYNDGAVATLKVFGSPYSIAHGFWAFGYAPKDASQLWDQIPLDSDLVVTHTPAKFHQDEFGTRGSAGCEKLRETLWRVRPRLFVCGHIHEAYGVEVVTWNLSPSHVQSKEQSIRNCDDPHPNGKKQYLVDLSSRTGLMALKNDGNAVNFTASAQVSRLQDQDTEEVGESSGDTMPGSQNKVSLPSSRLPLLPDPSKAQRPTASSAKQSHIEQLINLERGAYNSGDQPDQEAIIGREQRQETCIVNAAYLATNWPHKAGKKFHKPVVIDLDLPLEDTTFQASHPAAG